MNDITFENDRPNNKTIEMITSETISSDIITSDKITLNKITLGNMISDTIISSNHITIDRTNDESIMKENSAVESDQVVFKSLYCLFEAHIQEGIAIAYSGGVDSSLLLKIACEVGKRHSLSVLAVTFETKLHPHGDLEKAKAMAEEFGAVHRIIEVDEFTDPEIMQNPVDRCYRCKYLLFQTLITLSKDLGYSYQVDGTNYDDRTAYRPGMKALQELGIHSPLLENQITKAQIRSLAAVLNIASSDRPSAPCLATRLPYGTKLDFDTLARIDEGEQFVRALGFYNVRLRLHGDILRIEVDKKDFLQLLDCQKLIEDKLKVLGFSYITLDLEGFRSGSMDIHIQKRLL